MKTYVLFAHGSSPANNDTLNVPANCVVGFFNHHNQYIDFNTAEQCLNSLLKKNGILSSEIGVSLYLPGDKMVNYSLETGAKPAWMANHDLGLYEIRSVNEDKQLFEVCTKNQFKDNLNNLIIELNQNNNATDYILIVIACR